MERPSSDPRTQRTREQIFAAVQALAAAHASDLQAGDRGTESPESRSDAGGADVLSVSEIVRVAKISRSTFYAHFSDIDELAVAFLRATFTVPTAPGSDLRIAGEASDQTARRGYRELVEHIVDHYSVYQSTLTLPPMRKAYDAAIAAYTRALVIAIAQPADVPAGVRLDALATYVAGGAIAVIHDWLNGTISMSDDELVDQFVALLPQWLALAQPAPAQQPPQHPAPPTA